jgi:hypothetical protein
MSSRTVGRVIYLYMHKCIFLYGAYNIQHTNIIYASLRVGYIHVLYVILCAVQHRRARTRKKTNSPNRVCHQFIFIIPLYEYRNIHVKKRTKNKKKKNMSNLIR